MEGVSAALTLVVTLFVIIFAIVSFLLPFFVLRIRDEIISINKKMSQLISDSGGTESNTSQYENAKSDQKQKNPVLNKKYQCRICSKSYSTINNVRTHIRTSHELEGPDIDKNIKEL